MPEKLPKGIYRRGETLWGRFKVRGVEYRESLRTRNVKAAERALAKRKQEVIDAAYFGTQAPTAWKKAVVEWITLGPKAIGLKQATFDRYRVSLIQLRPWLDSKDVHEIDAPLLKKIVKDRQRMGVTNATIRRDMTAISSVLGHCVDENWIEENAARMIDRRRFKEPKAAIQLPIPDSLALVLEDASRFMDMARFSLETGMRQEEVASLTHDQIDKRRRAATLEKTKSGRVRAVTLSAGALAIIAKQPRHIRHRFVFWHGDGERFTAVAEQWRNKIKAVARKAAQSGTPFTAYRFHDLRHMFAVRYLRSGRGSIYSLQQELGHASIATTERYLDHLTPDEQMAAKHGVAQNAAQVQRSEVEK